VSALIGIAALLALLGLCMLAGMTFWGCVQGFGIICAITFVMCAPMLMAAANDRSSK
jgi:hypothetical protein